MCDAVKAAQRNLALAWAGEFESALLRCSGKLDEFQDTLHTPEQLVSAITDVGGAVEFHQRSLVRLGPAA